MELLKLKWADIERIELYGGTSRKTAAKVYSELEDKPDYIINGGMYDMTSGLTVCDTIVNGAIVNGGNYTNKGFGFRENVFIPETTERAKQNGRNYFLGGSPTLLWNRAILIDEKGFGRYFCNSQKAVRIAIGYNDEELMVSFPSSQKTLPELANIMLDNGCKYAINLDGGGSTRVMHYKNGKATCLSSNKENRANSTWILIYLKKGAKEKMPKLKVCVDAGHGGTDPGCIGQAGAQEKCVNLAIATKLRDALERNGMTVVMTRNKDVSGKLTNAQRCRIANDADVDYVISIHNNADGDHSDKTGYGTETWAYSAGGNGEKLAKAVQSELVKATKLRDRGVKFNKQLTMLKSTNAPAILIECAFLNNAAEEQLLVTGTFQKDCAEAICRGFMKHIGEKYVTEHTTPDYNMAVVSSAGRKECVISQENRDGVIWMPIRQVADAIGAKVKYADGVVTLTL